MLSINILRRSINYEETLSRFLTLKRCDRRINELVPSCFQTLIDTAIVVTKAIPGLFLVKLIYENRFIRYANSLLLELSRNAVYYDFQTIIYRRVAERNEIYPHGTFEKNRSLFVKKKKITVIFLGVVL